MPADRKRTAVGGEARSVNLARTAFQGEKFRSGDGMPGVLAAADLPALDR